MKRKILFWCTIGIISVLVVEWIFLFIVRNSTFDGYIDKAALIGDSFGVINAILSSFACLGMIYTLYLQRKDFELQRKELQLQRNEFITQNDTLKLQRFEMTFFNMLELQQQITKDLKLKKIKSVRGEIYDDTQCGVQVFNFLYEEEDKAKEDEEPLRDFLTKYGFLSFMESERLIILSHYFNHFFTILKFIDDAIAIIDKQKYASILRAMLSDYELIMLFYNGINDENKIKLIERYHMFINLNFKLLTISRDSYAYYEEKYGNSSFFNSIESYNITRLKSRNISDIHYLTIIKDDSIHKYDLWAFCETESQYESLNKKLNDELLQIQ